MRRPGSYFAGCIEPILDRWNLHVDVMADSLSWLNTLQKVLPQEVYNLTS
jgi:hypothetical protein